MEAFGGRNGGKAGEMIGSERKRKVQVIENKNITPVSQGIYLSSSLSLLFSCSSFYKTVSFSWTVASTLRSNFFPSGSDVLYLPLLPSYLFSSECFSSSSDWINTTEGLWQK